MVFITYKSYIISVYHFGIIIYNIFSFRCQEWMDILQHQNRQPEVIKRLRICNNHFTKKSYLIWKDEG